MTPREDKIQAKGKGEMQTYWVSISANTNRLSVRSHQSSVDGDEEQEDLSKLLSSPDPTRPVDQVMPVDVSEIGVISL